MARSGTARKKPGTGSRRLARVAGMRAAHLTIPIINLGTPGLDLSSISRKAEELLQGMVGFKIGAPNPVRKLLDASGSLRAIRDFGIVGAAEATAEEAASVRASVRAGSLALRPVLEALSLQKALWSASQDSPAVILLPLLMATWHRYDLRYHARTMLAGYPTLVSLPGLVEAPAKPKEYYILQSRGAKGPELDKLFRGRFLTHADALGPYLINYLAAAGAFYLLGEPFCGFPGCALYDSHWQKELLEASSRPLCERHERKLAALG